jgi:NAD+ kinase
MIASGNPTVAGVEASHREHVESLRQVRATLKRLGIKVIERTRLPTKPVQGVDLIVVVGGDGMVLGVSHAVHDDTPILAVNSAPSFSVGYLTGCESAGFASTLDALMDRRLFPVEIQRLKVSIGDRILPEPVLNDVLFCPNNPAVMCRYRLEWPDGDEVQRSSGVWVSTPAGSTSALASAGGPQLVLTAKQFAFAVREPYAPPGASVRLKRAVLVKDERLVIESRTSGVSVFLDGSHRRYEVEFGDRLTFSLRERPLRLVRAA